MGISKEQLAKIIGGKARDLCSPDSEAIINEAAKQNRAAGYYDADPSSYDGDAEYWDSLYTSSAGSSKPKYSGDIQFSEEAAANSRMDSKIVESLMKNPIDRTGLDPNMRSVLSDLDIKPKQRQRVNEQASTQAHQVSGVDYSIIKAIVNECLNEYFSKKPLNENATLSTIGLKEGNIKLVDNKGNVYSAKLQKIGNTNDK